MIQVSEWEAEPKHLEFMVEQIHKYNPGVATMRHTDKGWAVYRTDMKPVSCAEREAIIYKESAGAV